MIVVSDTSPIDNLAAIGALHLLESLYGVVVIPEAVYKELKNSNAFIAQAGGVQALDWVQVRTATNRASVQLLLDELDPGESESIALALESKAELLLTDEKSGRRVAKRLGLRYTGILGVLVEAKNRGLIDAVKPFLEALIYQASFWISASLYRNVLASVQEEAENE